MSKSSMPTVALVFPIYNLLLDSVEKFVSESDKNNLITLFNAGEQCYNKLKEFYAKTDDCDLYPIATSSVYY
jgi:hypothetical protein